MVFNGMKQQDIAILVGIVGFAAIVSYFVSTSFITPSDKKEQAEVVGAIGSEFVVPDSKNFNADSINPTKLIRIAPNENTQPFTQGQ